MKMGNTVLRAGLEPISVAFRASVQPHRLPDVTTIRWFLYNTHWSMQLLASEFSADYYTRPPEIVMQQLLLCIRVTIVLR